MAKRRPQGDGTIRKRSDGRWEARIIVGHKKVDVLPPEAADLASAQTRHDFHVEEVAPVLMPLDGFKEYFELIVAKDLLFGIIALGHGRAVCWIFCDQPFLDRCIKCFVKHHVYTSDHAVGKCLTVDRMLTNAPFLLDFIIGHL